MDSTQSPQTGVTTPQTQRTKSPPPATTPNKRPDESSESGRKSRRKITGLGIAEVVVGVISIAFAVAATVDGSNRRKYYKIGGEWYSFRFDPTDKCSNTRYWSLISQGIWCGLLTLTTGILGIVLVKKTSRNLYIANMVAAIITACTVVAGIVLSGLTAAFSKSCAGLLLGMQIVVAILCLIAMILTILHATFCYNDRLQLQNASEKSRQSHYEKPHQEDHYTEVQDDQRQPPLPVKAEQNQKTQPMYENPLDTKEAGVAVIYDEKL